MHLESLGISCALRVPQHVDVLLVAFEGSCGVEVRANDCYKTNTGLA